MYVLIFLLLTPIGKECANIREAKITHSLSNQGDEKKQSPSRSQSADLIQRIFLMSPKKQAHSHLFMKCMVLCFHCLFPTAFPFLLSLLQGKHSTNVRTQPKCPLNELTVVCSDNGILHTNEDILLTIY